METANVIGSLVKVTVDRPLGSAHPEHPDIIYGVNYGFAEGVVGGDGEAQDAYVLGVSVPVKEFCGYVAAVIVRRNDVETKWIVAPIGRKFSKEEIEKAVYFQERYFKYEVMM